MKNNLTIEDIKEVEQICLVTLTNEQRLKILQNFERVVMDKAESWEEIVIELIKQMK
jgi:hypothetical protein